MSAQRPESPDEIKKTFHDLNNALGAILMNLDILRERSAAGSPERVAADSAIAQAGRLETQLKELRAGLLPR